MKFRRPKFFWFILIISTSCFGQFTIPEKPSVETSVYDYVSLLNTSEKNNLERKLISYSDSTSTQIVVAIIKTTEGENINFLGAQWGQKWGIGQADKDNGVLVLLAREDRRIAINTGCVRLGVLPSRSAGLPELVCGRETVLRYDPASGSYQ